MYIKIIPSRIDGDIMFTRQVFYFQIKCHMPYIVQTAVTSKSSSAKLNAATIDLPVPELFELTSKSEVEDEEQIKREAAVAKLKADQGCPGEERCHHCPPR